MRIGCKVRPIREGGRTVLNKHRLYAYLKDTQLVPRHYYGTDLKKEYRKIKQKALRKRGFSVIMTL